MICLRMFYLFFSNLEKSTNFFTQLMNHILVANFWCDLYFLETINNNWNLRIWRKLSRKAAFRHQTQSVPAMPNPFRSRSPRPGHLLRGCWSIHLQVQVVGISFYKHISSPPFPISLYTWPCSVRRVGGNEGDVPQNDKKSQLGLKIHTAWKKYMIL